MDALRIILMILGLVLLAGIYLRGTWLQSHRREESAPDDESIDMEAFPTADEPHTEPWEGDGFSACDDTPSLEEIGDIGGTREADDMVVVLSVMAPPEAAFRGPEIMAAAKASGLHFGRMDIFHYFPGMEGVDDEPWFGIANALEPGSFDLERVSGLETPGLIFFLQLPGPVDGTIAFDRMVETARLVAERLDGRLCDQSRQPVEEAQLAELRERVRGFDAVAAPVETA